MDTILMWEESLSDEVKDRPFEIPDTTVECVRIQPGDHFSIFVPVGGGTDIYTLLVTEVEYHLDIEHLQDAYQYVFLKAFREG